MSRNLTSRVGRFCASSRMIPLGFPGNSSSLRTLRVHSPGRDFPVKNHLCLRFYRIRSFPNWTTCSLINALRIVVKVVFRSTHLSKLPAFRFRTFNSHERLSCFFEADVPKLIAWFDDFFKVFGGWHKRFSPHYAGRLINLAQLGCVQGYFKLEHCQQNMKAVSVNACAS